MWLVPLVKIIMIMFISFFISLTLLFGESEGLSIDDRAVLLAHSSSETTKIYTHPNLELAFEYINKMPDFS